MTKKPLPFRALSFDLARSRRADICHIKRVIQSLSELDFNMMTINLEHRFDFPSAPGLAPPGSLTTSDAREIVAFGKSLGVEVVGQPNLLGHCEGVSATERYARLSCDPHSQAPWGAYEQLNHELPETRDLVEAMLKDVVNAFDSEYVHIGCDEIRRMAWLFPNNEERQTEKMLEYVLWLIECVLARGRTAMIWGDMPLHHPEMISRLPRNVVICDWHYEPEGAYDTLKQYRDKGFRVLACPGASTWSALAVDHATSWANIRRMIDDAKELELDGFLLTTWEFGMGLGFDLVWPWAELASAVAKGTVDEDCHGFLTSVSRKRYELDNDAAEAFADLHDALHTELEAVLARGIDVPPGKLLSELRKGLFRAAPRSHAIVRPTSVPDSSMSRPWEPSPFWVYLYLRPVLSDDRMQKLVDLAQKVANLAKRVTISAQKNSIELKSILCSATALGVLTERLSVLRTAALHYHAAAMAQHSDMQAFRQELGKTIRLLEELRPGIDRLHEAVIALDAATGLDQAEHLWLDLHEQSLEEHVRSLRETANAGASNDSLLEFGEFLQRPARITPRLTWR